MDDTKTLKDQQITYTEDIINNLNQKTLPQISSLIKMEIY